MAASTLLEQLEKRVTMLEQRHVFDSFTDLRELRALDTVFSDEITTLQQQVREQHELIGLLIRLIQAKWPLDKKELLKCAS